MPNVPEPLKSARYDAVRENGVTHVALAQTALYVPLKASWLALFARGALSLGLGGVLLYWWGAPWSAMALPLLLMAFWLHWFRPPPELRCMDGSRWEARQRGEDAAAWQPVTLSIKRLGAGIIELVIDGQGQALWPDSADSETRRRLRRLLLRQAGQHTKADATDWPGRVRRWWQRRDD